MTTPMPKTGGKFTGRVYGSEPIHDQELVTKLYVDSAIGVGGVAPTGATYVTLSANGSLTAERVLTGTSNRITITDNGAGSTVVVSTPQDLHTGATPTFAGITLSNVALPQSSKTTDYTAASTDSIIFVDATGGNVTITLPTAVGIQKKTYQVVKTDGSANSVIIATTASQTISGNTTLTISGRWDAPLVVSDNSNWVII